jgi:parallel beta-helix repeat protein
MSLAQCLRCIGYLMCGVVLTGSPLGAQLVDAATYFVATNGNDTTGTGAIGAPFRNLGKALSVMGPGDTVFLRGGTYSTPTAFTVPCGAPNLPLSIRNYQTETVILSQNSTADRPVMNVGTGQCGHVVIEGSYNASTDTYGLVLHGVRISPGDTSNDSSTGGHHITIRNVEIRATNSHMITHGAHHIHLDNVNLHDNVGSHCIYVHWNDSIIENSKIHGCKGFGVHWRNSKGDQGKCQPNCGTERNIVRNNKIYNNGIGFAEGSGFIWSYGRDNQFYNNVVYHNREFGVSLAGSGYKVWNNTIVNNNLKGQASMGGLRTNSSAEIINNIVWGNTSQQIFGSGVAGSTMHHNLTTQDPLFVNASAGDFHIRSGSPAINAGVTLGAVTHDFFGAKRPVGSAYDLGVHEFGGAPSCPGGDCTPPSVPSNLILTRISATQIDGD